MAGNSFGQSAASYLSDSLSPSFQEKLGTSFIQSGSGTGTGTTALQALDGALKGGEALNYADSLSFYTDLEFGVDVTGDFDAVAENLTGLGALSTSSQTGWTFITAPEDISWDVANSAQRVDMFGTNNPPVVAGSRGMRDLTLSNALVEGFVRGVTVEGKIAALESLMNYGLNASDGFVSVPAYQVWANHKSYGGSEAYYIIKDVKVKEAMRDLRGDATRAYVDISLMQVPAYQVNSGRDQAGEVTAGGLALTPEQKAQAQQNAAAAARTQVDGVTNKPATTSPAGPNAGGSSQTAKPKGYEGPRGLGIFNLGT
jgi:hypothetical protein